LQPGERVTIRGELTAGGGHVWESQAEFVADRDGSVDASKMAPVGGTYKDVSPMGLVWSMTPVERNVALYQPVRNFGSQRISFKLAQKGGGVEAELERRCSSPGQEWSRCSRMA
jgi:hypothetical protein